MSRPHFSRNRRFRGPRIRTNERIRAREVRVVDNIGGQLGVFSRQDALKMARERGVDLVEVAEKADPPVCRLVDFGKYQYEQSKKKKENKKNQHANKTKEVQLSVKIDPHDLRTKQNHAIDFLCEDMKVKVTLRFRGRENAHTEVGFEVVHEFLADVEAWGHPDAPTKKIGRGLIVMISPLPKSQRAEHPGHEKTARLLEVEPEDSDSDSGSDDHSDEETEASDSEESTEETEASDSEESTEETETSDSEESTEETETSGSKESTDETETVEAQDK